MAKKAKLWLNVLELPYEVKITEHQPVPQVSPLYLMRQRVRKLTISPPRTRVRIAVETDERTEVSRPVKIVHVD
jgi:hypothetical protein